MAQDTWDEQTGPAPEWPEPRERLLTALGSREARARPLLLTGIAIGSLGLLVMIVTFLARTRVLELVREMPVFFVGVALLVAGTSIVALVAALNVNQGP